MSFAASESLVPDAVRPRRLPLGKSESREFRAGPDGVHQVRNRSEVTARVAIVSTQNEFGIVEYPEEKKVGIWAGGAHYTLDHPTG